MATGTAYPPTGQEAPQRTWEGLLIMPLPPVRKAASTGQKHSRSPGSGGQNRATPSHCTPPHTLVSRAPSTVQLRPVQDSVVGPLSQVKVAVHGGGGLWQNVARPSHTTRSGNGAHAMAPVQLTGTPSKGAVQSECAVQKLSAELSVEDSVSSEDVS